MSPQFRCKLRSSTCLVFLEVGGDGDHGCVSQVTGRQVEVGSSSGLKHCIGSQEAGGGEVVVVAVSLGWTPQNGARSFWFPFC